MIDLASVLTLPIAKLLLKSWLGDTGADIGVGLFQLGLKRLGDRAKARSAQHRAEEIADAVVTDLERFFANEHVNKEKLAVAATALGDTLELHVDAAFLVHQRLNAHVIEQELLRARPVDQISRTAEPEHSWYKQLVKALAPRLRAVAPELPSYELERDATVLERLAEVADNAKKTLDELATLKEQTTRIRTTVDDLATREERQWAEYEAGYRKTVLNALDYVEILGLDIERARREASLSIAYLSLTTSIAHFGRADYDRILDILPLLGNRLLVEGAAGSGKSTLLRWTAVEAARYDATKASVDWQKAFLSTIKSVLAKFKWSELVTPKDEFLSEFTIDYKRFIDVLKTKIAFETLPVSHGFDVWSDAKDDMRSRLLTQAWSQGGWRDKIPFLIRLRHLQGDFPNPEELPAHLSSVLGNPPENWVRDVLS